MLKESVGSVQDTSVFMQKDCVGASKYNCVREGHLQPSRRVVQSVEDCSGHIKIDCRGKEWQTKFRVLRKNVPTRSETFRICNLVSRSTGIIACMLKGCVNKRCNFFFACLV